MVWVTSQGAPYPEVTGPCCRVPSRGFSRAPEDSLLTHLCRFTVRSLRTLPRGFSRQPASASYHAKAFAPPSDEARLLVRTTYCGLAAHSSGDRGLAGCVPPSGLDRVQVVKEC
jgi:hypothetical protein